MNFDFGGVLTRAWETIWKHKILWVFGIFAGCSRGGGGGNGGGGGGGGNGPFGGPTGSFENAMNQFSQWVGDHPIVIVLFILMVLVFVVLAIFLGTIGRIGLIRGTYQAEQGAEKLVFGELFSGSMPFFWRVFGLYFLIGLVFFLIFIPFILMGVFTAGIGLACLLPLICILIPVSIVVNIVVEQANVAIVLNDLGIMDGLQKGWDVVKTNLGSVAVMAIILFVISLAVGFVIALPIIVTVLPLAIGIAGGDTGPLWIAGICCAVYIPILLVLNGILTSYIQSAWTLTYLRLTAGPDAGSEADTDESNGSITAGANA